MPKLTQEFIKDLTTDRDRTFFDTVQVGFAIRVLPTGVKTFVAKATVAGQRRKVTKGDAPTQTMAAAPLCVPSRISMLTGRWPEAQGHYRRRRDHDLGGSPAPGPRND